MYIGVELVSIFFGVISGIATTVILWIAGALSKKVVLPWYEQLVYPGVNVSGNWIHNYEHRNPQNSEPRDDFTIALDIEQKAHRISGTFRATATTEPRTEEYINYYTIKGVVKDNYVLFDYFAQRKDRTGIGSFLLRVSQGGTRLIGSAVFTPDGSIDDHRVVVRKDMTFRRN